MMNRSNTTWVTNMCQTLEDICTDIDKFVGKEPVSFVGKQMETVGNQMETVGANVKSFFSGIVDDFGLTHMVEPGHVAKVVPSKGINLAETSTNSVAEVKDTTVDINTNNPKEAPSTREELCHKPSSTGLPLPHSEQIISEISQHLNGEMDSLPPINETSDNATQVNLESSSTNRQNPENRFEEEVVYDESSHSDALAFEYSAWGLENIIDLNLETDNIIEGDQLMNLEEKKTLLNSPVDELECDLNTLTTHESSEPESLVTCNENQEENSKHNIPGGLSSESLCESLNSSFGNVIVEPDTIDCKPMETMDYLSVSSDILSSCGSFATVDYDTNNDAYASCSGTGLTDFSTVDFEDVKYDKVESGAVYEGEKLSLFPKTLRSKSYKKMIKDAFMSRKRITKEYKQLAIRYADIDKELCQPTQSYKPPAQDLPDSEWELV
ncbi:hypothetical protein HanPI659440_Chr03g0119081 [Helianthus annuus]|nr:hypothetical protein HanPI659440_Chr03g0119081 [Helianthus annuus]